MQPSVDYENRHLKELPHQGRPAALAEPRSWLWLATAAALLLFSNGANTVPLARVAGAGVYAAICAWENSQVGLPVAYLLLVAAFTFQFRGMVPNPGVAYDIFLAVHDG